LGEYRPYRLLAPARNDLPARSAPRIANADSAYLIADILSDNDARSLAFGTESSLRFDFPVACKTGTSSDFRDNWAFGYTPEFTVGVWIGNADSSPMQNVSGVTGAAPILHELFEQLHQHYGTTWYSPSTNIIECRINPITGKRLREPGPLWTAVAIKEKFAAQHLSPLESPDDFKTLSAGTRAVRLRSEYRDWFATGDNWLGAQAVLSETTDSLRILFPPAGTALYLDADLPKQGRRMYLRASGSEHLEWHSDSLSFTREGSREIALLTEGHHQIYARDPVSGAEANTWIDVRVR
jgi:penicillin-binding protein 1C